MAVFVAIEARTQRSVKGGETMYCKKCGSQLSPGAKFCKECGQAVSDEGNSAGDQNTPKLSKSKKSGFIKKIGTGVAIIFVVLIVIGLFGDSPVTNTKAIVFDHYGNMPIGDAAEANLESVEWDSEKNEDDSYTVTVRGIYSELNARVGIDFNYTESDEYCWASSECAYINGEYFYDDATITMIMALIYGDDDMAANAFVWSMIG